MDIQSTLKQHRDYYWDELYRINLAKDAINVAYYKKDSISSSSHEDSLDYFDLMKIDRLSKVDYIDNLLLYRYYTPYWKYEAKKIKNGNLRRSY